MLRLFSFKAQKRKDFRNPSKPCHVGTHWIALAEHSQMSTHLPGFQSFFLGFLHPFVLDKLATSRVRVKILCAVTSRFFMFDDLIKVLVHNSHVTYQNEA